ncbi:PQQ-like beta-propeller repeat protein [Collinsella sp. zg1085]|uniref:outer membrane protein assembly factor BamB family protein n=1 Tax=Collinsella sp. zg1085 TaxID=2844380 RepID=UPI001C0C0ADF|nr:PQQ-binding-like beta-propeller repeat protein [Collinsella sp. zg1085]QWT18033.1 PQQ-like beta-propeller repeat protein [Collinsella sp. zg1085]
MCAATLFAASSLLGLSACAHERTESGSAFVRESEERQSANSSWKTCVIHNSAGPGKVKYPYAVETKQFATTTNPVIYQDKVLIAAAASLVTIDHATGNVLHVVQFDDYEQVGVAGVLNCAADVAYLTCSRGYIYALDLAHDCQVLWKVLNPSSSQTRVVHDSRDVDWYFTDLLVHDRVVYLACSSYQTSPISHLVALSAQTGTVLWQQQIEGYISDAGNSGYPIYAAGYILLPKPQAPGILVFDAQTGEQQETLIIDDLVYMGFTEHVEQKQWYFQSRRGTVYKLTVDSSGFHLQAQELDGVLDGVLPSGARPVCIGETLLAAVPTASLDGYKDAERSHKRGRVALLDPESLELRNYVEIHELETTPVAVGERLYFVGRDGLYVIRNNDKAHLVAEHLADDPHKRKDVWDQPLLIHDGRLYAVGGTHQDQWLYSIPVS